MEKAMKLQHIHPDPAQDQTRMRDIQYLLQQPSFQELRPCAGCNQPCPCSQSLSCTCMCGPDCEHVPMVMSSDPERYPIEGKIVALVFGFNCLRICPPYWSCEGHTFPNGELFRVPQVWFYSRSMIYPKMIREYVFNLTHTKAIQYPWQICLAYTENSLETGFSIEPDIKAIVNPDLHVMQTDAQVVADYLVSGLKKLAFDYITKYKLNMKTV